MEKITKYKGPWWILALLLFAIVLTIALGLLVPPVKGAVFVYGSVQNYSAVILPNNSYVHQGENISQNNYYDLRGVYGFSGELAHWNDDNSVGQGLPDQIVTLAGYGSTYIDPIKFPVGRWWQWDGQYCESGSDLCVTGFGHGNAYVFYVNPQQSSLQEKTVILTSNITISQNGTLVQIPVTFTQVQTYYGTPEPTAALPGTSGTIQVTITPTPEPTGPVNPDVQDRNGVPISAGVANAVEVTPKSPVPVMVPLLALIVALVVMGRKK